MQKHFIAKAARSVRIESLEPRTLLSDTTPLPPPAARLVQVTVDPLLTHQTIEGFGGAMADWRRAEYTDPAFFDRIVYDLGATIARVALPPTFSPALGVYDDSALAYPMDFLQQMRDRGVNDFLGTVWTPPSWMKSNNASLHGGTLLPDYYSVYGDYLVQTVQSAQSRYGITLNTVSPQNEPFFIEPYVSAVLDDQQMLRVVRSVGSAFKAADLSTRILLPEDLGFGDRTLWYAKTTLDDPQASQYPLIVGTHGVWSVADQNKIRDGLAPYGVSNWVSEYVGQPGDWNGALALAEQINSALTVQDASAFLYWQWSDKPSQYAYALMSDGVPLPKYYAAKQFYRYVRPGAVRVDAASADSNLLVSAYAQPDGTSNTIVLINRDKTAAANVQIDLGGTQLQGEYHVIRSSATEKSVDLGTISAAQTLTLSLPAGSIVTLYSGPMPAAQTLPTAMTRQPLGGGNGYGMYTWLMGWTLGGNLQKAAETIQGGANVNEAAPDGWTALHSAAACSGADSPALVKLLLDSGAAVDARTADGKTPLMVAAANGATVWAVSYAMPANRVDALLAGKAQINARDNQGRTALHWAALMGKLEDTKQSDAMIVALLRHGADPTILDAAGHTALDYAISEHHLPQAAALQTALADRHQPRAALVDPALDFAALNALGYVDIRFYSGGLSGPTPDSLLDAAPEFALAGAGAGLAVFDASPQYMGNDAYRYRFTGQLAAGPLSLQFAAGTFANFNGLANGSLKLYPGRPALILPDGWSAVAVGPTPAPGGVVDLDGATGRWTLSGAGRDIWDKSDQFYFARANWSGDGTLSALAEEPLATDPWAKAGLMFRASDAPDAPYVDLVLTARHGLSLQWRSIPGGFSQHYTDESLTGPLWLKLTRTGNSFTALYSADGQSWTRLGQSLQLPQMPAAALAGLAVVSLDPAVVTIASFDNVKLAGPVVNVLPSGWSARDIGSPSPAGQSSFNTATGQWTLRGSGTDIWNRADQFQFASSVAAGDMELTALVQPPAATDPWAKAGLMFRASDTSDAAFADVLLTSANGVTLQWRSAAGVQAQGLTIPAASGPTWLKLTRRGSIFTAAYSADGQNWLNIGQTPAVIMPPSALAGLVITSHRAGVLSSFVAANVQFRAVQSALPDGFTSGDIGQPAVSGSAVYSASTNTWTLRGGGTDIWNKSDQFQYAWQSTSGDGQWIARVDSLQATDPWAKAGLMFRSTTAANSPFVDLLITPSNGVSLQWRATVDGYAQSLTTPAQAAPLWLKLARQADRFYAFYSADGQSWTACGSVALALSAAGNIGLAATSHNAALATIAQFSQVSFTAAPQLPLPAGWSSANIGPVALAGSSRYDGPSATWTLTGAGKDIWNQRDEFQFTSRSFSGDGTLIARVMSLSNTDPWAKAGVMFRASADPASAFVDLVSTSQSGVSLQWRSVAGGQCNHITLGNISGPVWLKLMRNANQFSAWYSLDGTLWQSVGQTNVALATDLSAGLALTSHNAAALATAVFQQVTIA